MEEQVLDCMNLSMIQSSIFFQLNMFTITIIMIVRSYACLVLFMYVVTGFKSQSPVAYLRHRLACYVRLAHVFAILITRTCPLLIN